MRPDDHAGSDDADLIVRAREGDNEAFGALWRRHADAVTRAARSFTGYDADDVASEAFVRVLRQVRAGGGPDTEPRAYLIRTARNVATEWARRDAGGSTTELDEEQLDGLATPDHADPVAQREVRALLEPASGSEAAVAAAGAARPVLGRFTRRG
ncbi:MAG: sigma-70 family RNA polymerase sigma factor, partial [Microbacteriaceae bacterium]